MKWLLAAAEISVVLALWRRGLLRELPALAWFSAFAALSAASYSPWDYAWFAVMSIPSVILRCWCFAEFLNLLLISRYRSLCSLIVAASCIGALAAFTIICFMERDYILSVMIAIDCDVVIAAGFWTMMLSLAFFGGMRRGWRRRAAVAFGLSLAATALGRIWAGEWEPANNLAMLVRAGCFLWLVQIVLQPLIAEPADRYNRG